MLATCEACKAWHLVDYREAEGRIVLLLLPDPDPRPVAAVP